MEKLLQDFGFTATEEDVYLTLLRIGPSTAGIIARKAGIHRRSVYDATARLAEKGLIGYISQNNRKYFEAVDPERLREILKEREENLNDVLPKLKLQYTSVVEKQTTLFFKGKDGLKNVFEDQIATGKEILILGASPLAHTMLTYYFHWFNKRREQKKIPIRLLYNEADRKKRTMKHAMIRYLPGEFQNPAAMNIYGDKVAIIHWSKERPFAILINEKEIAQGYRSYFELLWKTAKK